VKSHSILRLLVLALAANNACSNQQDAQAGSSSAEAGARAVSGQISSPDAGASGATAGNAGSGSAPSGSTDAGWLVNEDPPNTDPVHTVGDAGANDSVVDDEGDAAAPVQDPSGASDAQAELDADVVDGPQVTTTSEEQNVDLFGSAGHRFWLQVSDQQLELMNAEALGEPALIPAPITFADHVLLQDAVTLSVADYGKVEVAVVGESRLRPWTKDSIPNLRIDANEFQNGARIGSFEHLRLNNSVVGGIFREDLAYRIYRALGYPAARSTHAFFGSNVWGDQTWVPITLVEVYKRRFCTENSALIGGGASCPNMWEFEGDIGNGPAIIPADACQLGECDDTPLEQLATELNQTPAGPGFMDALDAYVSWDHVHRFQCLSWIMGAGDDMIHNGNNNVIIERDDGKVIWVPYSLDVSAGHAWHMNVPLTGMTKIAQGCQADPDCWAETIDTCETLIDQFDALNPELMLDDTVQELTALGMLSPEDVDQAAQLRQWLVLRQGALHSELDTYRPAQQ
jgi:hypothetical protein